MLSAQLTAAGAVNGKIYAIGLWAVWGGGSVRPGHQHLEHGGAHAYRECCLGRG